MNFQPYEFVRNLKYMGIGMLGVFMIVGIIMGSTYLIGYLTAKAEAKKKNNG